MESIIIKPILEIFKLSRNLSHKFVFGKHPPNVPTSDGKTVLYKHNPCMRKLPIYASFKKKKKGNIPVFKRCY